jgi:hypothetical protein
MSWTSTLRYQVYFTSLTFIGKPGKGIFLIKERAKLLKAKKRSVKRETKIKMIDGSQKEEEKQLD